MNPGPRENWLALALLDGLLTAMGFFFVVRACLRHLAAGRQRPSQPASRRRYEN
jgi:hypothetical protein